MGIASNTRYQLVKGLRRSLCLTPPFTGRLAQGSEETEAVMPREEVDVAPVAPDPEPPVKAVVKRAVEPAGQTQNDRSDLSIMATAPRMVVVSENAVEMPGMVPIARSAGLARVERLASSTSSTTAAGISEASITSTQGSMEPRKKPASAWSFAAGLVLGVVGSSAAWSWATTQAVAADVVAASGKDFAAGAQDEKSAQEPEPVKTKESPPPGKVQAPKAGAEATTPVPGNFQKLDAPPPSTKRGVVVPTPKTQPASPAPPASKNLDAPPSPLDKKGPDVVGRPKMSAPATPRAEPATNFDKWKAQQIAGFESKFPELHPWFNTVIEGSWRTTSKIVSGTHPAVKARSPEHIALLKWLTLEPSSDPDTRRATLNFLVRLTPVNDILDIWEPLIKNGASNTADIQAAADVLRVLREGKLTADQTQRIQAIIDLPAPAAKP